MVLDTSVILSILLQEAGSEEIRRHISRSAIVFAGAPTVAEAAIVLSAKLKRDARPIIDGFLREAEVEVIPFSGEHYQIAAEAFQRYGKGRHPAALNFGDCLTYAIAYLAQFPLLATGNDFRRTDLKIVPLDP